MAKPSNANFEHSRPSTRTTQKRYNGTGHGGRGKILSPVVKGNKKIQKIDADEEELYDVEAIIGHRVDNKTKEISYQVKWEGYERMTWEPEDNLKEVTAFLEYLKTPGNDLTRPEATGTVKAEVKGAPRRATHDAVRHRRKVYPDLETANVAADAKEAGFKPPAGSWEDEIVEIEASDGPAGSIVVYLTWKGGQKTRHSRDQVYKRCPQKMLRFYESHLVFAEEKGGLVAGM